MYVCVCVCDCWPVPACLSCSVGTVGRFSPVGRCPVTVSCMLLLLLCTQPVSQSLCLSLSLSLMLLSGAKSLSGSLEPPRYLLSAPTARTEMQCFLSVRAVHMASGDKYNPRYGPHTAASTNQNSTSIFCCTAVFIFLLAIDQGKASIFLDVRTTYSGTTGNARRRGLNYIRGRTRA